MVSFKAGIRAFSEGLLWPLFPSKSTIWVEKAPNPERTAPMAHRKDGAGMREKSWPTRVNLAECGSHHRDIHRRASVTYSSPSKTTKGSKKVGFIERRLRRLLERMFRGKVWFAPNSQPRGADPAPLIGAESPLGREGKSKTWSAKALINDYYYVEKWSQVKFKWPHLSIPFLTLTLTPNP